MKTKNIKQAPYFPAAPDVVYAAWMDSQRHGQMIDAHAKIDPKVGGQFSIWDDYMTGETLELDPAKRRIVQSWRDNSSDWPEGYYSKITLEFTFDKVHPEHTRLRFWHSGIPEAHADSIKQGWIDYYWNPMETYFSKHSS